MAVSSSITPRVVRWAAQECHWQQSGELSVANMIEGWLYARRRRSKAPTTGDILKLGMLIEPKKNLRGLREVDVRVGWDVKLDPTRVPDALERLVDVPLLAGFSEEEATEWFRQYEEIHPFVDGNGRTGSILYNWLRGSLAEPHHPPNLWDDPRRGPEGGFPRYPEP